MVGLQAAVKNHRGRSSSSSRSRGYEPMLKKVALCNRQGRHFNVFMLPTLNLPVCEECDWSARMQRTDGSSNHLTVVAFYKSFPLRDISKKKKKKKGTWEINPKDFRTPGSIWLARFRNYPPPQQYIPATVPILTLGQQFFFFFLNCLCEKKIASRSIYANRCRGFVALQKVSSSCSHSG